MYRVARCKQNKLLCVGIETTDNKGMNLINCPYKILFVGTSLRVGVTHSNFNCNREVDSVPRVSTGTKQHSLINNTSNRSITYFRLFNNSTAFDKIKKEKSVIVVLSDGWMDDTTIFYSKAPYEEFSLFIN